MAALYPDATSPIVAREREQAALRAALGAALAGRGALVLIGGAAGIGKTTLAEWLLAEAVGRDALALVGRCYDLSETPPYGPWIELFARAPDDGHLAQLPDPLGTGATTSAALLAARTADALTTLAARRTLVILLDDQQWADPASLDLLRFVARRLAEHPILLIATYRAEELAPDHPLAVLLPALVREARATRLDLRPLARGDLPALIGLRYPLPADDAARLAAYLDSRAEGNPFYLGELLRTLEAGGVLRREGAGWHLGDPTAAPVPALLRQIIGARVARLGADARDRLLIAAVLGQDVSLDLWAAVSAADVNNLLVVADRAIAVRLLIALPDGSGVRFAHALVREALYEEADSFRRRGWHRQAAEALVAIAHPDPDAVAYHFGRAGDSRALPWLIHAGLRARHADAPLTAAERLGAAAALLNQNVRFVRERAWLTYYYGQLVYFVDAARTLHSLEEAEPLALLAGDRRLVAHIHLLRGMSYCLLGQLRTGLAEMSRAVIEVDTLSPAQRFISGEALALGTIVALLPEGEGVTRAATIPTNQLPHGSLVNWLGIVGRYREALKLSKPYAREIAAALGESYPARGAALSLGLGHVYGALGRPVESRREYGRSLAGFRRAGDTWAIEYTLWFEILLAILPYHADEPAERAWVTDQATWAWERQAGTRAAALHGSPVGLFVAILDGRWLEARQLALGALATATSGYVQGAICAQGLLARNSGNPDVAWAQVRQLHPAGPTTEPGNCQFPHGIVLQALAVDLALDAGDLGQAEVWLAAHARWLAWSGAILWRGDHELLWARHARLSGDLSAARAHAETALTRASAPRQPLALLAAHRTLGELATVGTHHAEAERHLAEALGLADACAAPYERALTLLALAELRAAVGQSGAAMAALAAARALLVPLVAHPALSRAESLAARLADAAIPASLPRPDGLSPREAEVLRLLAAGRSTGQIAQALFLSPRTVQRHVANAYLKIGAHNKAEATVYALRHRLT